MSSVPPTTPPGGAPPPYPPYDPKTQWRVYREQQKAAWRAQRDAWKAQRYAMKSSYAHAYGPRVPSLVGPILLVCIGIIALLIIAGRINAVSFWTWYAHWWPLLLIVAGLGLLAEWAIDLRRETPVRRGGSFIGILVLLAILGVLRRRLESCSDLIPRQVRRPGRRLLQRLRPARARQRPAGAERADSRQRHHRDQDPRGDVSVTAGTDSNHQGAGARSGLCQLRCRCQENLGR